MRHISRAISIVAVGVVVSWLAVGAPAGTDRPRGGRSGNEAQSPALHRVAAGRPMPVDVPAPPEPTCPSPSSVPSGSAEPSPPPDTAAARYGWTNLLFRDDFDGAAVDGAQWHVYDSAGHNGQGRRSPAQVTVDAGLLTITGTPTGTTGGMASRLDQQYGRWEIRARFPAGCACYHPVLLLWPLADNPPDGGEIDYAEVLDGPRQQLNFFLHHATDHNELHGSVAVDLTGWHSFAVEWTPDAITGYLDGAPFYRTTQRDAFPPGPMHQTIQLDWFPGPIATGAVLEVDWATVYAL